MRICFLTQTASDISPYYKEFFAGHELFFVTFKNQNPNAVGFMPKSSWSDGRNKLWESVKDKYDYYVFMDDDLLFYAFNPFFSKMPLLGRLYHFFVKRYFFSCFSKSTSGHFITTLKKYLEVYKPEVMSVTTYEHDINVELDRKALMKNSFVRRMGFFDAQFTVFSNYAANKLLPYDTKFSGWWSSQIPIYLYSFNVFASKAINLFALAVTNNNHVGAYVPNYDGIKDCKNMLDAISSVTNKNFSQMAGALTKDQAINMKYGEEVITKHIPYKKEQEDYKKNFDSTLKGIESLLNTNMVP